MSISYDDNDHTTGTSNGLFLTLTFLFQAIYFSQTVLNQTIQFSIIMQLVLFNPLTGSLSGANAPGQSGPGSDGNEGVLFIPQSSSNTGNSPSHCLVSYQDTHWQVLLLCREAGGVFYSPSRMGSRI